ncbi:hypothetical protein V8E52_004126, partial [Russula decolorans]
CEFRLRLGTQLPFMFAWLWPSCGMSAVVVLDSALSSMFVRSGTQGWQGCCSIGLLCCRCGSVLTVQVGWVGGVILRSVLMELAGSGFFFFGDDCYHRLVSVRWNIFGGPLVNEGRVTETPSL